MEEFKELILERHNSYSFYYEILQAYEEEYDRKANNFNDIYEFYTWYVTV
jgi:hypothetical protein